MLDKVKVYFSNPEILGGLAFLFYINVVSCMSLLHLKYFKNSFLYKLFYLRSKNSKTHAILLGGLSLNILMMISTSYIIYKSPSTFLYSEMKILKIFIYALTGTLLYGYIDDRYEVRPFVKLCFQFISNSLMAVLISQYFYQENSALAFVFICFISTVIMNGSNLIDGLDTLASKIALGNAFYFFSIGILFDCHSVVFLSLMLFVLISSFYIFNKEPARIYLGEIGSVSLGLSYIIMGMQVFINLRHDQGGLLRAASLALIPSSLFVVELFCSFSRRFINQRSPFRGDHLHVHYLIKARYQLSASQASTAVALIHLTGMLMGLVILKYFSLAMPLLFQSFFYITVYLLIGYKAWFQSGESVSLRYLSTLVLKEKNEEKEHRANVLAIKSKKPHKKQEEEKKKAS